MTERKAALYYSWSRRDEAGAPLGVIENRFPTLFESRRMLYPRFDELRDPERFDQSVEHIQPAPHLPHFERLPGATEKMEVLARQAIDTNAPPHPFTHGGRLTFDALLQSRSGVFGGDLLVRDTTLWSSTAGGVDSLRRFWSNVVQRAG
jgi:hypothetical protein